MATKTLVLATCQVGSLSTTQISGLNAVQISSNMSVQDFASIANAIVDDQQIVKIALGANSATIQPGVIFTATITKKSASMTSFALVTPAGAAIASLSPGSHISGRGLALGTRVLSVSGTTVTLDRAAISSTTAGVYVATGNTLSGEANMNGWMLEIPNRGRIQMWPGDVLAIDTLGFPHLFPAISVNFNGGGKNSGAPFLLI